MSNSNSMRDVSKGKRLPKLVSAEPNRSWGSTFEAGWDAGCQRGYATGWRDAQESRNQDEMRANESMMRDLEEQEKSK